MRIGLILLTLFGQLAAPWLCCCTAQAFAAPTPPKIEQPATATPAPAAPRCSHCCAEPETPANVAQVVPSPNAPVPLRPCPCAELKRAEIPVLAPERVVIDGETPVLVPFPPQTDLLFAAVVVDAARPVGVRTEPTLTTAERLYAHHVLRC